jgi:hypothetical protein
MRIRPLPRILLVLAVGLAGVACSGSGSPGSPTATTPAPAPTTTSPGFGITLPGTDIQLDGTAFGICMHDGGIDVSPEDPRFGATTEIQVDVPTTEFGGTRIGVFVYADAAAATASKSELDAALEGAGSQSSLQFGNVLVAGLQEVLQDPESADALTVLVGCLI